jgi:hypothetical protein
MRSCWFVQRNEMRTATQGFIVLVAVTCAGGCTKSGPSSRLPSARSAIDRMYATHDCGIGIQAHGKIDHFGKNGRVRLELLTYATWPARVRMDVLSPFGVNVATLTSDGSQFALTDLRDGRFLYGPSTACNIARLTTVPIPAHALVSLLRGEAPVLKNADSQSSIEWDSQHGSYLITLRNADASERVKAAPHPNDFQLPWDKQRMRILDVEVSQQKRILYHAELADHQPANGTDGGTNAAPPCNAELPRRIHIEVPSTKADVIFNYDGVTWNPPTQPTTFTQTIPTHGPVERVECD